VPKKGSIKRFSESEMSKLSIAVAIAQNPKIIILDDPFAALGVEEFDQCREVLLDYCTSEKALCILFSKNPKFQEGMSKVIALLERGHIRCVIDIDDQVDRYKKIKIEPKKDYDPDDFKLEGVLRVEKDRKQVALITFENVNYIQEMLSLGQHRLTSTTDLSFSEYVWAKAKRQIDQQKLDLAPEFTK
jgi:ABC-type multidrug transport system ATPase subunit